MRHIFVDTSAWYALADPQDVNHEAAILSRNAMTRPCLLITTNYILDELYTLLLFSLGYRQTVTFKRKLELLVQTGILEILWISQDVSERAWSVFEQFNTDKEWSFTDCTSYVVMKQEHIDEAFTFDHHFAQMGFFLQ